METFSFVLLSIKQLRRSRVSKTIEEALFSFYGVQNPTILISHFVLAKILGEHCAGQIDLAKSKLSRE